MHNNAASNENKSSEWIKKYNDPNTMFRREIAIVFYLYAVFFWEGLE